MSNPLFPSTGEFTATFASLGLAFILAHRIAMILNPSEPALRRTHELDTTQPQKLHKPPSSQQKSERSPSPPPYEEFNTIITDPTLIAPVIRGLHREYTLFDLESDTDKPTQTLLHHTLPPNEVSSPPFPSLQPSPSPRLPTPPTPQNSPCSQAPVNPLPSPSPSSQIPVFRRKLLSPTPACPSLLSDKLPTPPPKAQMPTPPLPINPFIPPSALLLPPQEFPPLISPKEPFNPFYSHSPIPSSSPPPEPPTMPLPIPSTSETLPLGNYKCNLTAPSSPPRRADSERKYHPPPFPPPLKGRVIRNPSPSKPLSNIPSTPTLTRFPGPNTASSWQSMAPVLPPFIPSPFVAVPQPLPYSNPEGAMVMPNALGLSMFAVSDVEEINKKLNMEDHKHIKNKKASARQVRKVMVDAKGVPVGDFEKQEEKGNEEEIEKDGERVFGNLEMEMREDELRAKKNDEDDDEGFVQVEGKKVRLTDDVNFVDEDEYDMMEGLSEDDFEVVESNIEDSKAMHRT